MPRYRKYSHQVYDMFYIYKQELEPISQIIADLEGRQTNFQRHLLREIGRAVRGNRKISISTRTCPQHVSKQRQAVYTRRPWKSRTELKQEFHFLRLRQIFRMCCGVKPSLRERDYQMHLKRDASSSFCFSFASSRVRFQQAIEYDTGKVNKCLEFVPVPDRGGGGGSPLNR